jgi:hypothetical protein
MIPVYKLAIIKPLLVRDHPQLPDGRWMDDGGEILYLKDEIGGSV